MDIDSSPRTRKRARPLHQHLYSSSPAASATPLSAVKRRKLDTSGSSPSTPKALQVLKTAIGGVFNFGKTKEIANGIEALETASQVSKDTDGASAVFDEFIDELLAEESQDPGINGNHYESGPLMANHPKQYANGDTQSQDSRPRRKGRRSRGSANVTDSGIADDINELLNDENHHDNINGNHLMKNFEERQITPSKQGNDVMPDPKSSQKRIRSRTSVTTADTEAAEDELSAAAERPADRNIRKAGAEDAESFTKRNLKWHTQPATTKTASPDSVNGAKDVSVSEEPLAGSAGRPSRDRRRPRRYSNEMLEDIKPKPTTDTTRSKTPDLGSITNLSKKLEPVHMATPKKNAKSEDTSTTSRRTEARSVSTPSKKPEPRSILTPSKRTRERPRKSVTFGVESPNQNGQDLATQDVHAEHVEEISTSAKRKRGRPRNMTDSNLASADSPSDGMNIIEKKPSVTRDESRRSPRQKADTLVTLQQSKPSKGREPSVEKTSVIEEDILSRERRLRSPKRREGREASVIKTSAPEDKADSKSDDITCVICGGGDSEPPNEILLCDNCDLAAHQVCYGVQVIPEGDWLCRDCRPDEDEELMLVDTGTISEPSIDMEASDIPDIEGFEYHMQVMQKLVLDKLTGQRRLKLYGLVEEYQKVHQVVEQTVLAGEGNSMVVIGARGCGKTAVSQSG